jgi:DHA1 family multidrug resistance protein-like MFS transporter
MTPRRHMGYAMGLLQVGFGGHCCRAAIGGAMNALNRGFYITAAMLLLAGFMVWMGVRENFNPQSVKTQKPEGFISSWRGTVSAPGMSITFSIRFLTSLGSMLVFPIMPFFIQTLIVDAEKLNTFTGLVWDLRQPPSVLFSWAG